jgi:ribosomal protein S18 acetylase RimI-like enzyme
LIPAYYRLIFAMSNDHKRRRTDDPMQASPSREAGAASTTERCIEHITDKVALATFLGRNAAMNTYLLGDLEDALFLDCCFLALLGANHTMHAVLLIYTGLATPCVQLLAPAEEMDSAAELLQRALADERLPKGVFEAHMASQHMAILRASKLWNIEARPHQKMVIRGDSTIWQQAFKNRIDGPYQEPALKKTYAARLYANPGVVQAIKLFMREMDTRMWFDPRMLLHETYWGIFKEGSGKLLAMAGTHVVSKTHSVAALGNICTHPKYRRKGLARSVSITCIADLLKRRLKVVALNVESSNTRAIALYQSLGFEHVLHFEEADLVPA